MRASAATLEGRAAGAALGAAGAQAATSTEASSGTRTRLGRMGVRPEAGRRSERSRIVFGPFAWIVERRTPSCPEGVGVSGLRPAGGRE